MRVVKRGFYLFHGRLRSCFCLLRIGFSVSKGCYALEFHHSIECAAMSANKQTAYGKLVDLICINPNGTEGKTIYTVVTRKNIDGCKNVVC